MNRRRGPGRGPSPDTPEDGLFRHIIHRHDGLPHLSLHNRRPFQGAKKSGLSAQGRLLYPLASLLFQIAAAPVVAGSLSAVQGLQYFIDIRVGLRNIFSLLSAR